MMLKVTIIFLKWMLIGMLLAVSAGTLLHYGLIAIDAPYVAKIVIADIAGGLIGVFCVIKAIRNVEVR